MTSDAVFAQDPVFADDPVLPQDAVFADDPVSSQDAQSRSPTPEGERVPNAQYDPWVADVTDEHLRSLYRDLLLTRRVDLEATALQRQGAALWAKAWPGSRPGRIRPGHGGQRHGVPTYREHGVALTRGVDPMSLLGSPGVSDGGWNPNERNFALYTIVIGNQCLHAVGYAMGVNGGGPLRDADHSSAVVGVLRRRRHQQGRRARGDGLRRDVHGPGGLLLPEQPVGHLRAGRPAGPAPDRDRAAGYGIPALRVDGNDVLACWPRRGSPSTGPDAARARRSSRP